MDIDDIDDHWTPTAATWELRPQRPENPNFAVQVKGFYPKDGQVHFGIYVHGDETAEFREWFACFEDVRLGEAPRNLCGLADMPAELAQEILTAVREAGQRAWREMQLAAKAGIKQDPPEWEIAEPLFGDNAEPEAPKAKVWNPQFMVSSVSFMASAGGFRQPHGRVHYLAAVRSVDLDDNGWQGEVRGYLGKLPELQWPLVDMPADLALQIQSRVRDAARPAFKRLQLAYIAERSKK
jgi:hypothetical protein